MCIRDRYTTPPVEGNGPVALSIDPARHPGGSGATQTARRNRHAVHSAALHAALHRLTRPMAQARRAERGTRRVHS
eukprot:4232466-Prymnesium_polylepis.1